MNFNEFVNISAMQLTKDVEVSQALKYHLDNKISLCENIFRIYSESYFSLIAEVRDLYNKDLIAVNDDDAELVESDLGETAEYEGKNVYLDAPMPEEEITEAMHGGKNVRLNKPFRTPGANKKFAVYVKSPSGNVRKIGFGDPHLSVKNANPARAKSFRARHKCSEKHDKTKAGYWACNIGRYAKSVGLTSSRPW